LARVAEVTEDLIHVTIMVQLATKVKDSRSSSTTDPIHEKRSGFPLP
jgi:hypothetical protein